MAQEYPYLSSETEPPKNEDKLPAWRYADAICRTLKAKADPYVREFRGYWDYLLGKGHWTGAATRAAKMLEGWSFRGVVNDLYAVIDTKTAMITGSPTSVTIEPVGAASTEYQRLQIKAVIEDEQKRVYFDRAKKDAYQWGSATGLGVAMWSAKPDALTGDMALHISAVNPGEVFCDSDCFETAYVWVWYPELKMSEIRRMWPSKADELKPSLTPTGAPSSKTYKPDSTDENLIYGSTGEYMEDSEGIKERKARCAFVWIKDPDAIIEELQKTVLREAVMGLVCVSCSQVWDPEEMPEGMNQEAPCPNCGGDMMETQIPAREQVNKITRRQYPYGRLTVISGKTLFYDGENPYEIEEVFPGAAYHHYRVPGILYGFGDVALLRSLQEETDTTIGQIIDYVRLAVNGPTIYPMGFKSITELDNGPNERHPGPDHAKWLPYILSPQGFNVAASQLALSTLGSHFVTVAGLGDLTGLPSNPPISATEVEATATRSSIRMKGGHAIEFGSFLSRLGSIQWQMMKQFYTTRDVALQFEPGSLKAVQVQMADMPPNVRVRVDLSLEAAQMDKLEKQVLQGFIAQGGLDHPDADVLLETFGQPPNRIKELMDRRALRKEIGIPEGPPVPQGEPAQIGGVLE